MSTPEPYTRDEMTDDATSWAMATPEQKAAAFLRLFGGAAATALTDQNRVLIETLREIRAQRDGTQA